MRLLILGLLAMVCMPSDIGERLAQLRSAISTFFDGLAKILVGLLIFTLAPTAWTFESWPDYLIVAAGGIAVAWGAWQISDWRRRPRQKPIPKSATKRTAISENLPSLD